MSVSSPQVIRALFPGANSRSVGTTSSRKALATREDGVDADITGNSVGTTAGAAYGTGT